MNPKDVKVLLNPEISENQLWDFYVRNDICEAGYGDKKITAIPLKHSHIIIGAFYGDKLVGILRALSDYSQAIISEFCLELELQGDDTTHGNGSLIKDDKYGIAKQMGELMKEELIKIGVDFISAVIVENIEESVYSSIGLIENTGHKEYIWDNRPYVKD